MVAPTDSPVFAAETVDGAGNQCSECGGYYFDSAGQPVYSVDYVRYWDCWLSRETIVYCLFFVKKYMSGRNVTACMRCGIGAARVCRMTVSNECVEDHCFDFIRSFIGYARKLKITYFHGNELQLGFIG
jgi:hypothetical protein